MITARSSTSGGGNRNTLSTRQITNYIDSVGTKFIDMLDVKGSCRVATTQALISETWAVSGTTYDNVAGTITQNNATEGVLGTIDGVTLVVGDRVLLKNEGLLTTNGIYTVQTLGDGLTIPFVFKRAADSDHSTEVSAGNMVYIETGTINTGSQFALTGEGELELGVDDLVWNLFGGGSGGLTDILIDSVGSNGGTGVNILTHNSIEPADPLYAGLVNSQIGRDTNPYQQFNVNAIHMRRYLQDSTWRDGQIYLYSNDPTNPNPTLALYGGSSAYPGYIGCHRLRADYISAGTSSVVIVDTDLACKIGSPIQSSLRFGEDFANGFYQATPFSISYSNGTEEKVRFADGLNIQNSRFNKMGIYFGVDNPTLTGIFQETANTFGFASNGVTRLSIGNNNDVEISNSPLKLFAGNIGAPGVNWGDATTGFYRPAANQIAATVSGTQRLAINSSGITVSGTATLPTITNTNLTSSGTITSAIGSAASPSVVVGGSCGFYRINADTLCISTAGGTRIAIDSSAITVYPIIFAAGGGKKPGGGSWADSNSDFNLKRNIEIIPSEDCLNRISSLQVKSYQFTEEASQVIGRNPLKVYTGMIAQDYYGVYTTVTQNTTPYVINGVEAEYLQLDTTVAYFELFGAIKALKLRDEAKDIIINNMTTIMNNQATVITDLLARVEALETPP